MAKYCATSTKPGLPAIYETERVKYKNNKCENKREAEIGRVFKNLTTLS